MAEPTVASENPKYHRESRRQGRGRKVSDNQAQAVAKFLRVPPRKARFVIDEVRGLYVQEALAFLNFIPNRAADHIGKVVTSAASNGVNNHNLRLTNLKIVEARVDEGPRMKRMQPRAQGRAYAILKRTCHITITVEEVPRAAKPRKLGARAAAARAARVTTATATENND